MKEFFRKQLVSIKRNPQNIPLIVMLITFLVFTLNLTSFSVSTSYINRKFMGLCEFAIFLLSTLAFVCAFNSFPKRQRVKIPMLVLLFLMLIIVLCCDCYLLKCISDRIATNAVDPINAEFYADIIKGKGVLIAHIIMIIVTVLLYATLPLYTKLLRKINTSIAVDDNGEIGAIDVGDAD